jgi:hypothetical protein
MTNGGPHRRWHNYSQWRESVVESGAFWLAFLGLGIPEAPVGDREWGPTWMECWHASHARRAKSVSIQRLANLSGLGIQALARGRA